MFLSQIGYNTGLLPIVQNKKGALSSFFVYDFLESL